MRPLAAPRALSTARQGHAQRGVTLMELMVVVAILAVITTIAVPTYRKYLLRSQRSEAKIALLQVQTAQEKFYLQNNAYTEDLTSAPPAGLGLSGVSETGKYDISVEVAADEAGNAAQTFVATATAHAGGGQEDDKDCGDFMINERGTRTVSGGYTPERCWK